MVGAGVAQVRQSVTHAGLEHRNRLRKTPAVKLDELLGQGMRGLLPPNLEDRLYVLGDLAHLASRHVGEHVALEVHHPNAIGELRATVVIPFVSTTAPYKPRRRRRR